MVLDKVKTRKGFKINQAAPRARLSPGTEDIRVGLTKIKKAGTVSMNTRPTGHNGGINDIALAQNYLLIESLLIEPPLSIFTLIT